jgi:uncharacterized protein DUF6232
MTTADLYGIHRLPHPRPPSDRPAPALVRYRRHGVIVTDRVVVTASGARYRVADLDRLYTSPGPVPSEVVLAIGVTATLAVALLLVSVVRQVPEPYLVGLAGALLVAAVARLSGVLRPRRLVLLATRGPEVVVLHSGTDHRTVGQIARAVQRAMERVSDARTGRI